MADWAKITNEWFARGWTFVPNRKGTKVAAVKWKELQDRQPTSEERVEWLGLGTDSWSVITGRTSGLVVLDFDSDEAFQVAKERGIPDGPRVKTAKGWHCYFQHPGWDVPNGCGIMSIDHLDLRGDGGYVVGPGSVVNGSVYEWVDKDLEIPEMPDWFRDALIEPDATKTRVPQGEIREGVDGRNNAMWAIATSCRGMGFDRDKIMVRLMQENKRCVPEMTASELMTVANSAMKYQPDTLEQTVQKEEKVSKDYRLTDVGNSRRLADDWNSLCRYVEEFDQWVMWDGRRWGKAGKTRMIPIAEKTIDNIFLEAKEEQDEDIRKALKKHAKSSENVSRIKGMIELAKGKGKMLLTTTEFDRDPWLFNVRNGTIDLRTGVLMDHSIDNLITKYSDIEYTTEEKPSRWFSFLDEVMNGDTEAMTYLQKLVGYCMTGDTSEQKMFLLMGGGSNGKSTFVRTIMTMLGDYAQTTQAETLLNKSSDSGAATPELASLKGARFVAASEPQRGKKLNEARIKMLTGQDEVRCRYLNQNEFSYTPQCKILLTTNERPIVQGTDDGIWRRIQEIPFKRSFKGDDIDPDLMGKLLLELPQILGWAVRGCKLWQEEGLGSCPIVDAAVAEYRNDMDEVGQFIEQQCSVSPGAKENSGDLYGAYVAWCRKFGEQPMNNRAFGKNLSGKGFGTNRTNKERFRIGIELDFHYVEGKIYPR